MVRILYFAWVRDAVGMAEEAIVLPNDVFTVGDLAMMLADRSGGHAQAFGDLDKLRCAVEHEMVSFDAPIAGAKEIAFFPPVTGG